MPHQRAGLRSRVAVPAEGQDLPLTRHIASLRLIESEDAGTAVHASPSASAPTGSTAWPSSSPASTSSACRTRCASCSRACCARATRTACARWRRWDPRAEPSQEIAFAPARILLQDFTGVPAVVDLAAMRDAIAELGGDPARINPSIPAELVIDHSVQVDAFATRAAFGTNVELELERNRERYAFLRWGQRAFADFKVVPPGTGICHQVNLEYLARVVEDRDGVAFPDTVVGTDSHTTMVNGLGVLGWGVGGIEAEAAMLGEPLSMLVPQVVGFRLHGRLREGTTATDLVLTVTELLRKTGVVGKFVEYFGEGLAGLSVADRSTLGNMSPEYGATCGFFPVDELTLDYLRLTGRSPERVALVEAYCKENLLWHEPRRAPEYSQVVELDLGDGRAVARRAAAAAGPRAARPREGVVPRGARHVRRRRRERRARRDVPRQRSDDRAGARGHARPAAAPVAVVAPAEGHRVRVSLDGEEFTLDHGAVVIAAITSCTNTSNPQVMIAAGLVAKKAVELGLRRRPWVKSSLAPGSRVVTDYYERAGLQRLPRRARLQHGRLRLHDLHRQLGPAARRGLGRDRRGRPRRVRGALGQPQLRGADPSRGEGELPRLAAARRRLRARRADGRRSRDGAARAGATTARDVYPARRVAELGRDRGDGRVVGARRDVHAHLRRRLHRRRGVAQPAGARRRPLRLGGGLDLRAAPELPRGAVARAGAVADIEGARCLVVLGDSVTTDHISPAGSIRPDSPAGRLPRRARRRAARTSTRTARGAATTR